MADLSEFTSSGTGYNFSKGPKGIYYANGDQDLLGVILNVPQTDEDDEWGGTERIALERITDTIGTLQEYVFDPAGGGNGLDTRVSSLEGILDTSTPKLTLGTVVIDGSTNTISIGATAGLTEGGLTLKGVGGNLVVSEISPITYGITYKTTSINFINDGASVKQFTITVGTATYAFTQTGLSLTSLNLTGALTVTGTITGTNGAFTGNVHGATICGDGLSVFNDIKVQGSWNGSIIPDVTTTYNLGNPTYRWNGIAGVTLNLTGAITGTSATFSGAVSAASLATSGNVVASGSLSGVGLTVTGTSTTHKIVPDAPGTRDIGDSIVRYATMYGTTGNFSSTITAPAIIPTTDIYTIDWTDISGSVSATGWASTTTLRVWYKKWGKFVYVNFFIQGTGDGGTAASLTLPTAMKLVTASGASLWYPTKFINNSASTTPGLAQMTFGSSVVNFYTDWAGGSWTASVARAVGGELLYVTD